MAIEKVKENYQFSDWDEKHLIKLMPIMEEKADAFVDAFYVMAFNFKNAEKYLKNGSVIEKHKSAMREWFLKLFDGQYDDEYLRYLEGIGSSHVKIELPSHYVNVSISFVKKYCTDAILSETDECRERTDMIIALGKILDINLDVLTSSYIEEEKNIFFLSKKAENKLINFAERFSYGLNLLLLIGLSMLGLIVIGLFVYDVSYIFQGNMERGLLATLGALLMLWVVIELVDTEVEHMRGAKFSVKVFVSVAMVAVIRKILITTLDSDTTAVQAQYSLILALGVLGLVYWLVTKTEKM